MKKSPLLVGIVLLFSFYFAHSQIKPVEFKIQKKIPVKGTGGWDCLTVENIAFRLFIAHGDAVDVLDLRTEKIVGQISKTPEVHAIAIAREFNKGFITAGKLDSVVVFDLNSLAVLKKIKAGKIPDGIIYDPFTKRVFVFNSLGKSVTAIDPKTDEILGTTDLPGKPETAVTDGKGLIYCNILDKSTIIKLNGKSLKVEAEWPLKPGKEPTGLAFDLRNNRLFSACSKTKQLVVMSAIDGAIVDTLPIGSGCDGVAYLPEDQTILTSNGDGTMTVIFQKDRNTYEVTQTLITQKSARTLTYGLRTRKLYLPCADVTIENGKRKVAPGSFKILVVGK
jgi:DNA-binding beta-propeller fold protein YncE